MPEKRPPSSSPPPPPTPPRPVAGPHEIWIGDVIGAWRALGAHTPEEKRLIAQALGFQWTGAEEGTPLPIAGSRDAHAGESPAPASSAPIVELPDSSEDWSPAAPALEPMPLSMSVSRRAAGGQTMSGRIQPGEPLERERPEHVTARPPHDPLFRPGWARAILGTACATRVDDGPVDVERLVHALASCQPIATLPRASLLSLRRGMQLLVDRADSLTPFWRDIRDLVVRLRAVVGRDRSQVLYFAGAPQLGAGPGGRSTWRPPPAPPSAGTPVILITDFGAARRDAGQPRVSEAVWLAFLAHVRACGCPVVAFSPYPIERWPAAVVKQVHAIWWDRSTTVTSALRAARANIRP